jgi:hypothetical protein
MLESGPRDLGAATKADLTDRRERRDEAHRLVREPPASVEDQALDALQAGPLRLAEVDAVEVPREMREPLVLERGLPREVEPPEPLEPGEPTKTRAGEARAGEVERLEMLEGGEREESIVRDLRAAQEREPVELGELAHELEVLRLDVRPRELETLSSR